MTKPARRVGVRRVFCVWTCNALAAFVDCPRHGAPAVCHHTGGISHPAAEPCPVFSSLVLDVVSA